MNANAEDPGTAIDGHPVTCGSTKRRTRAPRPTERLKGGMSGFDKSSDLALRALATAAQWPLLRFAPGILSPNMGRACQPDSNAFWRDIVSEDPERQPY